MTMDQDLPTPPKYPIDADEVLRLAGRMPRLKYNPRARGNSAQRLKWAKAQAILKLRLSWGLTAWKDPEGRRYLYDRDEVERKKKERWSMISGEKTTINHP